MVSNRRRVTTTAAAICCRQRILSNGYLFFSPYLRIAIAYISIMCTHFLRDYCLQRFPYIIN